jgi:hypothetical protein
VIGSVLCSGKRFRPNNKRTTTKREGKQNEIKERDSCVIIYIKGILRTKENICHLSPIEEDPT